MAYVNYDLPLYRTGFRPYGLTNTWTATQLGQVRPFTERGGWKLGAVPAHYNWQRSFSPRFLTGGLGTFPRLGQTTGDCSNPSGDFISCSDPSCSYGPCGPAAAATTECSDASGAFVMCGDPNCKFGPCMSVSCPPGEENMQGYCIGTPTKTGGGGGVSLPPGSSPRVPAPQTMFPPTAASSAYPAKVSCPSGYTLSAQGQCAASGWTQLQPYLPLMLVVIGALALTGGRR